MALVFQLGEALERLFQTEAVNRTRLSKVSTAACAAGRRAADRRRSCPANPDKRCARNLRSNEVITFHHHV